MIDFRPEPRQHTDLILTERNSSRNQPAVDASPLSAGQVAFPGFRHRSDLFAANLSYPREQEGERESSSEGKEGVGVRRQAGAR